MSSAFPPDSTIHGPSPHCADGSVATAPQRSAPPPRRPQSAKSSSRRHAIDTCTGSRGRRAHRTSVGIHPDADKVTGFDKLRPAKRSGVLGGFGTPSGADGVSDVVQDHGAVLENRRGDRVPGLRLFGIPAAVRVVRRGADGPPRPERRWLRPRMPAAPLPDHYPYPITAAHKRIPSECADNPPALG